MSEFGKNIEEIYFKLRNRDPERAIEHLFKSFYPQLVRTVYRYTKDNTLAEDIVQDVFYDFWKKRDQLNVRQSIFSYLKRAAINKTLNHFRDKHIQTDEWEDHKHARISPPKPLRELEADELSTYLDKVIADLPDRCRIVFLMSREEEKTYKEIAESLDISVKTVENQISKALKRIREALSKDWPNITFAIWLTFFAKFVTEIIGGGTLCCVCIL